MADLDRIDATCVDCAYMNRDREGGRWCRSPQLLTYTGHTLRCVWERDAVISSDRGADPTIRKCGPQDLNYKMKEAY